MSSRSSTNDVHILTPDQSRLSAMQLLFCSCRYRQRSCTNSHTRAVVKVEELSRGIQLFCIKYFRGVIGLTGPMRRTYCWAHKSETASQHTSWRPNGPKSGKSMHFPLNGPITKQNKAYQAIFCTLKTTSGFTFLLPVL